MNASKEKGEQGSNDSFALKTPTLSLPKGGGAIRGIGEKFTANPVSGTGSMSIPIAASPGRAGFSPQLSLSYDSGAGNSVFGLGWNLALPAITRKTDKGLPRYNDSDETDVFIFAGAEDLVAVSGQEQSIRVYGKQYHIHVYRPRIEGLFARLERWTEQGNARNVFWRSISRDNITTWYGHDEQSRVFDPNHPTHIYQWLICQSYDDKGNAIEYRYSRDAASQFALDTPWESNRDSIVHTTYRYPSQICYSHKQPFIPTLSATGAWPTLDDDGWLFRLVFDYGDSQATPVYSPYRIDDVLNAKPLQRLDAFSNYRAGFEIRCHRLCRRTLMFHDMPDLGSEPVLVRATEFIYRHPAPQALSTPTASGYTRLISVVQRSYERDNNAYHDRGLPPVEFKYSEATVDPIPKSIAANQLPNLPVGTHGMGYQWIDLDGEGLSGVLSEQQGAWYYKGNLGNGTFAPQKLVSVLPSLALEQAGRHQFLDLGGDGDIDVVDFNHPTPGFYERDVDQGWKQHIPFATLPNIDWNNPNLRFVDLSGDGHADALLTEDEVFTWYPSLGESGFGESTQSRQARNEDEGPRLLFAEVEQTVFLADMCGDGLTDLVRIRNGDICYWPNLGYGRFGRKVTLGNSPRFDHPDLFDSRRIRLTDIDGSGPIDIIYLGRDGARAYFNRSGNSLSDPLTIALPVATENLAAVQVADLLGNGTACLVWNSHLPADANQPMRYIDLMGGNKPHLLTEIRNNLGALTTIEYKPSTYFYLQDLAANQPWITRLAFPVHCVSKVTLVDKWRGTTFSNRYSYHHGYFDGTEREFRGFGRVEQIDIERFSDPVADQAPIKTVTWYHTGAAFDRQRILNQFSKEYFPSRYASRLVDTANPNSFVERDLPQPELPQELNSDEWREALRACKGMVLRQETYELDPNTHQETRLYSAATHNCRIQCLQRRGPHRHAVFLVSENEAISYQYELTIDSHGTKLSPDPRITHTLNLRHDEYGNPQQTIAVGYPRWTQVAYNDLPAPSLIRAVQSELHLAYSELRYTSDTILDVHGHAFAPTGSQALRHHRLRVPCETQTFELGGVDKGNRFYYSQNDFAQMLLSAHYGALPGAPTNPPSVLAHPYHRLHSSSALHKRLVEHSRSLYFDDVRDDAPPTTPLLFGHLGPRGLKYEDYKLALTNDLLDQVLATKLDWPITSTTSCRDLLNIPAISGYVTGTAPGISGTIDQYWMRSGIAGFASDAHRHFYLPENYTDAFGNTSTLQFDLLDLFVTSSRDALGNTSTIERFDYRVLAPTELVDINGNHTEVVFDTLGLPIASAIKGKQVNGHWQGDTLTAFSSYAMRNPNAEDVYAFVSDTTLSEAIARSWLAQAGSRFVYHFGESYLQSSPQWEHCMPSACTIVREQHQLTTSPLQVTLECSDGLGHTLMKKAQAEPEQQGGSLRWIVNGLTILNNKGKPVKQYEPTFSHHFGSEMPSANGASSIMHYDAAGRVVRTDAPDGTFGKVEFSPWHAKSFDASDTVLESNWYRRRTDTTHPRHAEFNSTQEQRAARLSAEHNNTPALVLLDSLGREVISVAHNRIGGLDERYLTFTKLDAEGKPLWIVDARGNKVMQYVTPPSPNHTTLFDLQGDWHTAYDTQQNASPCYDIAGNLLFQHSMDGGDRWTLNDAAGKPMFAWDIHRAIDNDTTPAQQRLYISNYDSLHRPTALHLKIDGDSPTVIESFIYQDAANAPANNLNGQATHHFDASGLNQVIAVDFKGSPLEVRRTLIADKHAAMIDWQGNLSSKLEKDTWIQITQFDALNRMTRLFNWHRGIASRVAVYEPQYNERGTLKSEALIVKAIKTTSALGYSTDSATQRTTPIANITHDAKGQRLAIELGNGTSTHYHYDAETYRVKQLRSTRPGSNLPFPSHHSNLTDNRVLQQLNYSYDANGNIVEIYDEAYEPVFFQNQHVDSRNLYEYDALYRLTWTQGRESAQGGEALRQVTEPNYGHGFPATDQTLRRYTQSFAYDSVGNFISMSHSVPSDTTQSWKREYAYAFDDPTQPASNRLWQTWTGGNRTQATTYHYDSHGSMLNLANAPDESRMQWDHRNMITKINLGGGGYAHYQYDTGKQRTRKLIVKNNGNIVEERIYLGGLEFYRRTENGVLKEEIETLHLFDGEQRLLMVDQVNVTDNNRLSTGNLYRYIYSNHLGSANLELDDQAQIISYEEYHPYGTSAYRTARNSAEARLKRYRYTGMERDEESGLSYHTARYYLPWLGRWMSVDPIGTRGGLNCYLYSNGAPNGFADKDGKQPVAQTLNFSDTPAEITGTYAGQSKTAEAQRDLSPANSDERRFWEDRRSSLAINEAMTLFRTVRDQNAKMSWALIGGFFITATTGAAAGYLGLLMLAGAGGAGGAASVGVGTKILIGINIGLIGSGSSVILQQAFRTSIGAPLLTENQVLLEVGTSALAPAAIEGIPAAFKWTRQLPASAKMDAAIAADRATPLFRKGADMEPYAVSILDEAAALEGSTLLPTKLNNSNHGLDTAFQGLDASKVQIDEIKTIYNFEAGDLQTAVSKLKSTKTMGDQMSTQYVAAQANKLIKSSNPQLPPTGTAIQNATEVSRYVRVIDKYGAMHTYDMDLIDLSKEFMPKEWINPFIAKKR